MLLVACILHNAHFHRGPLKGSATRDDAIHNIIMMGQRERVSLSVVDARGARAHSVSLSVSRARLAVLHD